MELPSDPACSEAIPAMVLESAPIKNQERSDVMKRRVIGSNRPCISVHVRARTFSFSSFNQLRSSIGSTSS